MSDLNKRNAGVNLQKKINYVHTDNTCKQKSFHFIQLILSVQGRKQLYFQTDKLLLWKPSGVNEAMNVT